MRKSIWLGLVAGLAWAMAARSEPTIGADPGAAEPVITSIRLEGTNVIVVAQVPPGITRVTLQGCRRLAGEAWTPRAVARLNGAGGEVTLRVARSTDLELLRVRADEKEALPSFFYQGPTSFAGQPLSGGTAGLTAGAPGGLGVVNFSDNDPTRTPAAPTQDRAVVESDIWKLDGDTLYFFNQYRGLQVIDVSQPDAPLVRGTLSLAAAGEQMYLFDDSHVVLLVHDGCSAGLSAQSQVAMVEIRDGTPKAVGSLPIEGVTLESRMVGNALYVASGSYRPVPSTNASNGALWEWGTVVSSFDLSQPTQPVARSSLWVAGSGTVVTATDRFLFVASNQSADGTADPTIRIFDISAPDGTLSALSNLQPAGQVRDKFKMHLDGEVFSVVSDQPWGGTQATYVETFSLANPAAPSKLGSLNLVQGESLFGTRFDGHRLYAVTFHRVDPLWIVDLSDPAQPRISGQLQVPGWSTYLHPLGDRLLAVGRDNSNGWRTVLSLFEVADPANPALLSRLVLGDQYSSSQANYDEKALGVFPDAGLILLPLSESSTNGTFQGVQLVDLAADTLRARGQIAHPLEPRRATLHRDRILSWSGREFLSVDANDRDHPLVRSTTELSWQVDQVFLHGQYLLEISRSWWNQMDSQLRVALAADPNQVLNRLSLTNLPLLGATLQGDRLYLAQGTSGQIAWEWDPQGQTNRPVGTNFGAFGVVIVDLAQMPALAVSGRVETPISDSVWGDWEALWPQPGLLVWKSSGYGPLYYRTWPPIDATPLVGGGSGGGIALAPAPGMIDAGGARLSLFSPWFWGGASGRLFAFDVSNATAPQFASDILVGPDQAWNTTSRGFAADGLVYLSHREYEIKTTGTNYYVSTNQIVEMVTNVVTLTNLIQVPQSAPVTNYETLTRVTPIAILNRPDAGASWQWPGSLTLAGIAAGGGYHSLLLDPHGNVWDCGANGRGQLGNGAISVQRDRIETVPGLTGVRSVAAGVVHSLVLKSDGTVWAWGADMVGQLGDGLAQTGPGLPPLPPADSFAPVRVIDLDAVTAIAAGAFHSLALKSDGTVWSWGANWFGQLGDGGTNDQHAPKLVAGLDHVRALAGGGFHSLALGSDGTVWAWGGNELGQLGVEAGPGSDQPLVVPGISGVTAVAAGMWHSLALLPGGAVLGWGANDSGQLTDPATAGAHPPVPIDGLSDVVALAAGSAHNLALKSDGSVWTWGDNSYGQLGQGTDEARARPGPVVGLSNAVAVAAGDSFSLALTREGTLWAWGDNTYGQLGNGDVYGLTNDVLRTNVSTVITYTTLTNVTLQTNYTQTIHQQVTTNAVPIVQWFEHQYLDVVDFAAPRQPVIRPPVSIPGSLQGIAYEGALLFTLGYRPVTEGGTDWAEWLDATAYDGVEAHLVDSLALPTQWPHPLLVRQSAVFLGRPAPDTNSAPQLETWAVADTGKFTKLAGATLTTPAQSLQSYDDLLVVQNYTDILLFDAHDASRLNVIGGGGPPGCVGFNLDHADGSIAEGLWLPLGDFGVDHVPGAKPASAP
jgi:alpha-tubulin suppressor-like RCC1 family protein